MKLLILLAIIINVRAFYQISSRISTRSTYVNMGFFDDVLKKALANDPNLPPPVDPGLSRGPQYVTVEFVKDGVKKEVKAIGGQKIRDIASDAKVEIRYQCKKGECRTCEVNVDGKVVKACQSFIPSGKSKVQIVVPTKK